MLLDSNFQVKNEEKMKDETLSDSSQVRNRILNVSVKLFSKLGYEKTSIDKICKEAKVNRAMISYYYGGKLALYRGIIEKITNDLTLQLRELVYNEKGPLRRLRAFIELNARHNLLEPHIAEIIVREVGSNLANSGDILLQHYLQVIAILADVIQEGTEKHFFDRTIPPVALASFVFASLNSFFIMNRLLQQTGFTPQLDQNHIDLITNQLYKLIVDGISARQTKQVVP